ncbi:MAG: hypothetical protein GY729_14585, partial [Desulfobacteraceae bacterium]|nr:hypothetical protein [Desulfobacteraceae bacterium]
MDMNLRDFRNDPEDARDENAIAADSSYHEEINTLKIDKLSNRVTIISIILPCIIGAIIVFAYLDMKERVVDVDTTKQNQVEQIAKLLDEKLNTMDLKIAKNSFEIEKKLPEIEKQ